MKHLEINLSVLIHKVKLQVRFPCSLIAVLKVCTSLIMQKTTKYHSVRKYLFELEKPIWRLQPPIDSPYILTPTETHFHRKKYSLKNSDIHLYLSDHINWQNSSRSRSH